MSTAWATFWVLALVAAGVWLASRALPLWRCLHAIRTAPAVSIGSGAAGVVKVHGNSYPGQDVPEGFVVPGHVWRATERMDTRSSPSPARSSSYSVAPILVRDESAECIVDPLEAWVLPTETRATWSGISATTRPTAPRRSPWSGTRSLTGSAMPGAHNPSAPFP